MQRNRLHTSSHPAAGDHPGDLAACRYRRRLRPGRRRLRAPLPGRRCTSPTISTPSSIRIERAAAQGCDSLHRQQHLPAMEEPQGADGATAGLQPGVRRLADLGGPAPHGQDRPSLSPRIIVYYTGSNDVNAGEPAPAIEGRIKAFITRAHAALPETRIYFVAINRSPDTSGNGGTWWTM